MTRGTRSFDWVAALGGMALAASLSVVALAVLMPIAGQSSAPTERVFAFSIAVPGRCLSREVAVGRLKAASGSAAATIQSPSTSHAILERPINECLLALSVAVGYE